MRYLSLGIKLKVYMVTKKISAAASEMGKKGGLAKAKKIGKKGMSAMGKSGATKRWSKDNKETQNG